MFESLCEAFSIVDAGAQHTIGQVEEQWPFAEAVAKFC